MDVSVIIPTCARPAKLAACVGALARQSMEPGRYEVLVGVDGPDGGATVAAHAAWTLDRSLLSVAPMTRRGQAAVRNALLPRARGRTLVFLNDDMIPSRDLLSAHHAEQERQRRLGTSALVIGSAPWVVHQPDRLFDRLVRETSMVFFYNQMDAALHRNHPAPSERASCDSPLPVGGGPGGWVQERGAARALPSDLAIEPKHASTDRSHSGAVNTPAEVTAAAHMLSPDSPITLRPIAHPPGPPPSGRGENPVSLVRSDDSDRDRDWGFRHAWLLNLSADAGQVRDVGGFSVFPSTYGYEDDDLAFRMSAKLGTRVLYRPGASAHHDHRLEPASYLEREYKLGYGAWGFAGAAPECARAMFNRDIREQGEIDYCRAVVQRERTAADRALEAFNLLAEIPSSAIASDHAPRLIELVYQQHLPLKRYAWRRGLLDAAEGRGMDPAIQR